jgi:cystathionine beta-lyase
VARTRLFTGRKVSCVERLAKEDICTHLGDEYGRWLGAVVPPVFQSAIFTQTEEHGYIYTRVNNPTTEIAERKIAALEEGEAAKCFSSGMAAISAAVLHCVSAGSHIICVRNVYGTARRFFTSYLSRFGVEVTFVPGEDVADFAAAVRSNTRLIYLESPSSLVFSLQDLAAVAALAKAHGITTAVDNSWATPLYQNPLKLGIDLVIHSGTKYMSGHSDVLAGVVVGKRSLLEPLAHEERDLLGSVMDPHQAWLLIRGLRTLPIRLKQHQENAMQVARFLEQHSKVERVLYPGLSSHPQYELGRRQMSGYSGLLSFVPRGNDEAIRRMVNALRYFQRCPSWGGFESLVAAVGVGLDDDTARRLAIPRGLVRIHVGLEHVDTLIADLDQALRQL